LKVEYILDDHERLWLSNVKEAVVHLEQQNLTVTAGETGSDFAAAEQVLQQLQRLVRSAEAKGVTFQESFDHFDRVGAK